MYLKYINCLIRTVKDLLLWDFCIVKKAIGYRIRKLRESKDYNQENMGAELGITPGAYAKIERGETDPSATRLLQIAEILGVDVSIFFHDNSLMPLSRTQQPPIPYGTVSKNEMEVFGDLLKKMDREIQKIKSELASLKKAPAKKASSRKAK